MRLAEKLISSKSRKTQTKALQLSPGWSKEKHSSSGTVPPVLYQSLSTLEGLLQALCSPTSFSLPLICLWQQRHLLCPQAPTWSTVSLLLCPCWAAPTEQEEVAEGSFFLAFPVSLIGSVSRTEQSTLHMTAQVTSSSVTVRHMRHTLL